MPSCPEAARRAPVRRHSVPLRRLTLGLLGAVTGVCAGAVSGFVEPLGPPEMIFMALGGCALSLALFARRRGGESGWRQDLSHTVGIGCGLALGVGMVFKYGEGLRFPFTAILDTGVFGSLFALGFEGCRRMESSLAA